MSRKQINIETSRVEWTGKKIGGKHSGSIKLKDGYLEFENNELKDGEIVIDMRSINSEDLTGKGKKQLEDHLHSDDFFNTENHTTSTLKITGIEKIDNYYRVVADMKIKGQNKPVEFDLKLDDYSAWTELNVDRSKYNIRYASKSFFKNLGDNVIHNNFALKVDLKF